MRTKFSFTILCILLLTVSFAQVNFQPGYIIMKNGDTLEGFIDYRQWESNPEQISFAIRKALNPQEYSPISIRGFSVANEIYKSAIVAIETSSIYTNKLDTDGSLDLKTDTVFLQALVLGEKNLLYLKDRMNKEHFYIKNDTAIDLLIYKRYVKLTTEDNYINQGGEDIVVENVKFKGQLMSYLNNCPTIFSVISTTKYKRNDLVQLFVKYYHCVSSKCDYKTKPVRPTYTATILSGITLTNLLTSSITYDYLNKTDFNPSYDPSYGYRLSLVFPRKFGKWSVGLESLITFFRFSGVYSKYNNENDYTITESTFKGRCDKINMFLMHRYPIGKFYLTGDLGFSNGFLAVFRNKSIEKFKLYSTERVETTATFSHIRRHEQSLFVSLGAAYGSFSGVFRFERGNGFSDSSVTNMATNRFYFLVGFTFR